MARASTPKLVTRESLQAMIDKAIKENDTRRLSAIIGRALVVLFDRQTQDEKESNDTNRTNSIGFSSSDARQGSITAKTFLKRGELKQFQLDMWTARQANGFSKITKYVKQLNEHAVRKAQRNIV